MWRDLERICQQRGLPLRRPPAFPQNSVPAARLALAVPENRRPDFSRAVYLSEFGEGKAISSDGTLAEILVSLGLPVQELLERSQSQPVRALLHEETAAAQKLGLFGAPTFVVEDGEMFWGDDRLEQALAWAQSQGSR
jgi:2-hydroxychromene-2-carboxylate isomerase